MLVLSSPENFFRARKGAVPAAKHRHRALIPAKGRSIMHASLRTLHVSYSRGCPACGEARCVDPADCLHFMTSRPWGDCTRCEGSGWASDSGPVCNPMSVFCECCAGSGLTEHSDESISQDDISEGTFERHSAHVARLTALVPPARLAVAA